MTSGPLSRLSLLSALLAAWVFATGCTRMSQVELRYPVFGVGETPTPFVAGAWTITLTEARIGFGPVYFCATAAASSDLCPTAVSELASSVEVNGLEPSPQLLGEANGLTGTVRSAAYDFAYDWFTTQRQPRPGAGAPNGHSALFEGLAERPGQSFHFSAAIDLIPRFQDTRAVQGAPASAELENPEVELTIAFQPHAWWAGVDYDALAALPGDPVQVLADTPAYEQVVLQMTAGSPPRFAWGP